jgi:hypothetical protein
MESTLSILPELTLIIMYLGKYVGTLSCNLEIRGNCTRKEMTVILVYRVVDKKRIIGKIEL